MSVKDAFPDPAIRSGIERMCVRDPVSGCLEWRGCGRGNGYGAIRVGPKVIDTHRAMWMSIHGWVDRRTLVMHSCDNRRCCNPDHLSVGSYTDNARDMVRKGRHWSAKVDREMADRVIAMRAAGKKEREIVAETGLSKGTIWKICRGDSEIPESVANGRG